MRGFLDGGVLTFKGVPYGVTTAGENRWLPAKPPAPWADEYPALVYGANCSQNLHTWTGIEQTFLFDWNDGWQSEDMLKLNIWTPSLIGKRPVMFYMHGGGCIHIISLQKRGHTGPGVAIASPQDVLVEGWTSLFNLNWAVDETGWYICNHSDSAVSTFFYVDLSGHATVLESQEGVESFWGVPSPDGRHLAFSKTTFTQNAWLLENF